MNFSPLCKPSLILTISQPFLCTHQQARTKLGIILFVGSVSQQTARFQVFFYYFFFHFSASAFFLLWSCSAFLVLLMCCSVCVLAGFEVAFRACPPLIQDLDVITHQGNGKGGRLCPLEPSCPTFLLSDLSSSTAHCGAH